MSRNMIIILSCVLMTFGISTACLGVEFVYRGSRGYDYFSCGSDRRGGFVRVKATGENTFQIYSKRISGEFEISPNTVTSNWCLGKVGAARVACGACRLNNEDDLPFSNLVK